jgi:hypothetical protein
MELNTVLLRLHVMMPHNMEQAYGEEAIELHKEALRTYQLEKERRKDMPLAYNIS